MIRLRLWSKGWLLPALLGLGILSCASLKSKSSACEELNSRPIPKKIYRDKILGESDSLRYTYFGFTVTDSGRPTRSYFDRECNLIYKYGIVSDTSDIPHGPYRVFYPNGQKRYVGEFKMGHAVGHHLGYSFEGKQDFDWVISPDLKFGYRKTYDDEGSLISEGETFKSSRVGLWKIRRHKAFWGYRYEETFYDHWELDSLPKYNSNTFLKTELDIDSCLESEHFLFYCKEDNLSDAKLANQVLKEQFGMLSEKLRFTPRRKIQYNLFTRRLDFRRVGVNLESGVVGQCLHQGKVIVLTRKSMAIPPGFYKKLLVHELVHAFVNGIHQDTTAIPKWLNEGMAEYLANNPRFSIAQIKREVKGKIITSMAELDLAFSTVKNTELAYLISYYIVRYLDRTYGMDKLNQCLREPNKFETIFGFPQKQLWPRFKQNLIDEKMSLLEIIRN